MEIISEMNSSLHMSISNLNIQTGKFFIVYCFMKNYVSSLYSFPHAKHFGKKPYEVEILFLSTTSPCKLQKVWRFLTGKKIKMERK